MLQQYGDATEMCTSAEKRLKIGEPQSSTGKKFKSEQSASKVLFTLFRELNGPGLEHCHVKSETVNIACYSIVLEEDLKPPMQNHHREL